MLLKGLQISLLLAFLTVADVKAQTAAIRNNLLYDATLTPNIGAEVRIDTAWTAGVNIGLNAWDIDRSKNKKWRHVLVSPSARYWTDSLFHKHFIGIHGVYSHYNASGFSFPFHYFKSTKKRRRQGDLLAIGGSYGYSWRLNDRWHLEGEIGAALAFTWYKEYDCGHCGDYIRQVGKVFLLPKLGLNIVYNIPSGSTK